MLRDLRCCCIVPRAWNDTGEHVPCFCNWCATQTKLDMTSQNVLEISAVAAAAAKTIIDMPQPLKTPARLRSLIEKSSGVCSWQLGRHESFLHFCCSQRQKPCGKSIDRVDLCVDAFFTLLPGKVRFFAEGMAPSPALGLPCTLLWAQRRLP